MRSLSDSIAITQLRKINRRWPRGGSDGICQIDANTLILLLMHYLGVLWGWLNIEPHLIAWQPAIL